VGQRGGHLRPEEANPVMRVLRAAYRPVVNQKSSAESTKDCISDSP
jgi:hypothetical protein